VLAPFSLASLFLLSSSVPLGDLSAQALFSRYPAPKDSPPFSIIKEFDLVETPKVTVREVKKEKRLVCEQCNDNEQRALSFLQTQGIKDRNALATIMGNIRQESTFVPNICEGGARTSYWGCRSGGYGLIQWTCESRYNGLGRHASKLGSDPSSIDAQLSYLLTETQWKRIEDRMKTPGKSIGQYMDHAYSWIGWGHHGARTSYAYDYARKMTMAEVTV
jgi:hypothetical protein